MSWVDVAVTSMLTVSSTSHLQNSLLAPYLSDNFNLQKFKWIINSYLVKWIITCYVFLITLFSSYSLLMFLFLILPHLVTPCVLVALLTCMGWYKKENKTKKKLSTWTALFTCLDRYSCVMCCSSFLSR